MAKATRSGKNVAAGQPSAPKTRKAPSAQQKGKARAVEAEVEANVRPTLADMMDGAPLWARALFRHVDEKIEMLGDFVQDVDGRVETFRTQLDEMAKEATPVRDLEADDVEDVAVPVVRGADDAEKWAKLVERFNKLKPIAFEPKASRKRFRLGVKGGSGMAGLVGLKYL